MVTTDSNDPDDRCTTRASSSAHEFLRGIADHHLRPPRCKRATVLDNVVEGAARHIAEGALRALAGILDQ